MPSCGVLYIHHVVRKHSTSCTVPNKKDGATKKNTNAFCLTPESCSTQSPPHAAQYGPLVLGRTGWLFQADAGSYTRPIYLNRRTLRHTTHTFWQRVSSFYFWCFLFYFFLQCMYTSLQASVNGSCFSHRSCHRPAQRGKTRYPVPVLFSSSPKASYLIHWRKDPSLRLSFFALHYRKNNGLSWNLSNAAQRSRFCNEFVEGSRCTSKDMHATRPQPRTFCRGKKKSAKCGCRGPNMEKVASFIALSTSTRDVFTRVLEENASSYLRLLSRRSRQYAIPYRAVNTDQQRGTQKALQRKSSIPETGTGESSAEPVLVPKGARGQFPFVYKEDSPKVLTALLKGPAEAASPPSVPSQKASFIYFDNAATTQKPWGVLQAVQRAYIHENANVHRSTYSRAAAATERLEGVRSQLAEYLNAERPEEIVFTSGATDSINLVAGSWGEANISEGDEIVLSIAEHHSNIVPWQILATRKNASLKYIQLDEQHLLSVPSLLSSLSSNTKLVALSHTSNVLGSFNPYVREVVQIIKRFSPSIVVLLDASQALAHHKVDVRDLSCDFLVGSGHKMYGPTGVGFLYGRYKLLQEMPPWKGGGEMIEVRRNSSVYADPPARFEAGTPPFVQIAGLGAALDFMEQVGLGELVAYESKLHSLLRSALEAHVPSLQLFCPPGFPPPPPHLLSEKFPLDTSRKPDPLPPVPLVSFVHPVVHAQDIATFLDVCDEIHVRSGHHCCQLLHREALKVPATCRASLGIYNTEEEVHRFVKSVQSVITMLELQCSETSPSRVQFDELDSSGIALPQAEVLSLHSEHGNNLRPDLSDTWPLTAQ